ncbi:MAG: isoleucine--tRNA ligase [Candidatus Coatesbacteria bacterium]|nr:isoleucine--tRNA ligase [Candidatus Coatesbacteria bacterium]
MAAKPYKATLNLPRTKFPMRAGLPQSEPARLERWEELDLYGRIRASRAGREKFILHDGPPYANGEVHAGTALNKILKDVIVKFQTLIGRDAPYVPGWDCHGLPIEHKVAGKLGDKIKGMDRVAVRRACREFALRFVDKMRGQFKRLGVLGLWEEPYLTLDKSYEYTTLDSFRELLAAGYIYKGLKPVHWCASCGTALAEAEVEYADHLSHSVYVRFPVVEDPDGVLDGELDGAYAVIWTTTPWTLPSNVAVAVHPKLRYLLVERDGARYLLAEGLADGVYEELGWEKPRELKAFKGEELLGLVCRHPFLERRVVFVPADYVTLEQGTGLVHTAPGHGAEDFYTGRRFELPVVMPVDDAGRFTDQVPEWAGLHVFEANEPIVERMRADGSLLAHGKVGHSYPHCWRCKQPVIFRATEQYFLKADHADLRRKAVRAAAAVDWVPAWGAERMRTMLEQRPDWCLSRQRTWGVPIPALYCADCGELILDERIAARARDLAGEQGCDAWFSEPVETLVPEGLTCPECGGGSFKRETDILDVWFESGVSHLAVLKRAEDGLRWPADVYLEGGDQYRGWFQVSLLTALALRDQAPYSAVVTNGWVVDPTGRAMHKSLGNVVNPDDICNRWGADILRLWAASGDYTRDIGLGEELIKQSTEAYRRIRNTLRFMLGNLGDFDPATDAVADEALLELDRWALHRLALLGGEVRRAYEAYEFHRASHLLHNFCAVDLSAVYLDVLKDRLYCSAADSPKRRAAQTALYRLAESLIVYLSPILAYTADEAWEYLPGERADSVHLADWPDNAVRRDENLAARWETLMAVREDVLKALEPFRAAKRNSLDAAVTLRAADEETATLLADYGADELRDLFIVSGVALDGVGEVPTEARAAVEIAEAPGDKCPRCWHVEAELVDGLPGEEPVCRRCASELGVIE